MSESKELLEATVKGLQVKLEQLQTELNQSTLDIIYDCVTEGIEEFDFSDTENYDFEYELDYDGRINTNSIEFNSCDYVREPIIKLIETKFNIIDDTEENSAQ